MTHMPYEFLLCFKGKIKLGGGLKKKKKKKKLGGQCPNIKSHKKNQFRVTKKKKKKKKKK